MEWCEEWREPTRGMLNKASNFHFEILLWILLIVNEYNCRDAEDAKPAKTRQAQGPR